MSSPDIFVPPSFVPSMPDEIQIVTFGQKRIQEAVDHPYRQEMVNYFSALVMDISFSEHADQKLIQTRDIQRDFADEEAPPLRVGHCRVPQTLSLVPALSSAFVQTSDWDVEFMRPKGHRLGFYGWTENIFVQHGSNIPVVERHLQKNPLIGRSVNLHAFKVASHFDLMHVIGNIERYGAIDPDLDMRAVRGRVDLLLNAGEK
jgi:hypothetical protein